MFSSFSTIVATPRKCPGRQAPSSGSATAPTSTHVACPGRYISSLLGANTRSVPAAGQQGQIVVQRARIFGKIFAAGRTGWD